MLYPINGPNFIVWLALLLQMFRSSHSEVFLLKGIPKICSKLTGEHPCRRDLKLVSSKFGAYFQSTFSWEHLWMAASVYWTLYELQLFGVQSVKSYIGRRRVSTRNKKHVSSFVKDFHWSKSYTSFFKVRVQLWVFWVGFFAATVTQQKSITCRRQISISQV